jgi:hypothetical protein
MISLEQGGRRFPSKAMASALGICALFGSVALAHDNEPCPNCPPQGRLPKGVKHYHGHSESPGYGTLGYGPPGVFPGFQGFGLGYHLGYGYGGAGLGPGAEGGYPFYGGPGYPHPWPTLRRIGGINPFPYYGGQGYPDACHPNFYGGVAPLVADRPVIEIAPEPGEADPTSGYGYFTGAVPYPEAVLAPYTTRAGLEGSASGVTRPAPATPPATTPPPTENAPVPPSTDRSPGFDTEPVAGPGGKPGMKVSTVDAASPAAAAGLRSGDVIRSINGYVTQKPGNIEWIILNAAPDRTLTMNVLAAADGKERTITARLR